MCVHFHNVNLEVFIKEQMDESKVLSGASALEELANTHIVLNHFGTHLCESTWDHRFRALFGTSFHTAFLLWTVIDVGVEGPTGGHCLHMLWTVLFLKGYSNRETLIVRDLPCFNKNSSLLGG